MPGGRRWTRVTGGLVGNGGWDARDGSAVKADVPGRGSRQRRRANNARVNAGATNVVIGMRTQKRPSVTS